MRLLKPKLIAPTAPTGGQSHRWIAACLDYLRTECHLAVNSIAAYRRDLTRFGQWLAGRPAAKLGVRDLSDYMAWLQTRKLAPSSIARHMVAVKLFFRYLQLEGVVRDNPAELLGTQKTWERVPEVMSPAVVEQLLTAPQKYDAYYRRDRALLELLYATGCRASEVSHLKLADVHLAERYCLAHGKGSKDRITPLGGAAIAAIREYLASERPKLAKGRGEPPWLLLSRGGKRLRREA
ncbi:MAG: tyrosine-type recombinase/integrase, partial [Planctomycetia bacterium]|nr:tyrosine-type recombinase/integrase [Planctomycetia bacterium]